jgi:hypothetical protein
MDSYAISPHGNGTFTVEIRFADGGIIGHSFKTEGEAVAWVAERERMSEATDTSDVMIDQPAEPICDDDKPIPIR